MTVSTTKLYKILASQMNAETAETLTDFIVEKVKEDVDSRTEIFLTKDDKVEIVKMIADTKNAMILWMFVFWIGQVAVISGILMYLLKGKQ